MQYTLYGVNSDPGATVAFVKFVPADWVLVDLISRPDGSREALYQHIGLTANAEHPAQMRVGFYPKGISVNVSLKFTTYMEVNDGTNLNVTYEPVSSVYALTIPKGALSEPAVPALITNTVNWLLPISAAAFTLDALSAVKFGVVNTLPDLA